MPVLDGFRNLTRTAQKPRGHNGFAPKSVGLPQRAKAVVKIVKMSSRRHCAGFRAASSFSGVTGIYP